MLLNYCVCYLTGAHMIKSTHRHYFFLLFKTVEFPFSPCSSVAVKLDGRHVKDSSEKQVHYLSKRHHPPGSLQFVLFIQNTVKQM